MSRKEKWWRNWEDWVDPALGILQLVILLGLGVLLSLRACAMMMRP